jgi:uncharacterized membrane protein YeaQ/YmgE (transglycosylase-associated protein family)
MARIAPLGGSGRLLTRPDTSPPSFRRHPISPIARIILWLVIGAVAGWLAGNIMKGGGFGLIGNIIVGIVGALIGGFVFGLLGITAGGLIGSLITAVVGACVLLFLVGLVKRA